MKAIKSRIFAAMLGAVSALGLVPANAQQHEMSVHLNGGLATYSFQGTFGPAFAGGISYSYFFFNNSPLAVTAGVNVGFTRTGYTADNMKSYDRSGLIDEDQERYELRTSFSGYHETQQVTSINIPLMLHYLFPPMGEAGCIYTGFGVKFGLPISARYKSSVFSLTNVGHYSDGTFEGDATGPRFAGFGEFSHAASGELEFNPSISLSAEAGWRFPLSERTALYAGIYIDYGLNDVRHETAQAFVVHNPEHPDRIETRSILNTCDEQGRDVVKHLSPFTFGMVAKFSFGSANELAAPKKKKTDSKLKFIPAISDTLKAITNQLRREQDSLRKRLDEHDKKIEDHGNRLDRIEEMLKKFADQRTQQLRDTAVVTRIDGFELNGYTLNAKSRADMDHNVAVLKKYPNMRVFIQGYGDDIGSPSATMLVSRRRAEMVKIYLLDHGIAPERIIATVGRGSANPVVPNINEAYRKLNRRVEISVRQ